MKTVTYDEAKFRLGKLCPANHEHESTGMSLRWKVNGSCVCCHEEHRKEYYLENRESIRQARAKHYARNKELINARRKEPVRYEKTLRSNREYRRDRRQKDISFRISENLRGRIYKAMSGRSKGRGMGELTGCTISELKSHIEAQFKSGMSWENYGEWHIDHIRPCSSFNLAIESEQLECFNYTNLQPLWAAANLSKKDSWKGVES